MTTKTANREPELDQIVKSRLSHHRSGRNLTFGDGKLLHWRQSEGYMGNVGLTWLFERKYKMWWHFPELYNPQNYFSNPVNIYGAVSSINVLALPEEKQANIGLREVINADEFPVTDTDTPPS